MKISDFLKIVFGVCIFCFSNPGFTDNTASRGEQAVTEVACRYEMKLTPYKTKQQSSTIAWFFWRTADMVQTQDADGDLGEIWERTNKGGIQYRKLYHADKTAVEYMPADMPTNNMNFDWFKLSSMLGEAEFEALKPVKKTRILGRSAELLKGSVDGQSLEVLWLPDEKLPASIVRKDKTGSVALRLVEIAPLSTANWKPVATDEIGNYRHIDAADFGDMENDPFVKKVMAAEGHHH